MSKKSGTGTNGKDSVSNPLGGRAKDPVWLKVTAVNPKEIIATCNSCNKSIMNLVDKIKKHIKNCNGPIDAPPSASSESDSLTESEVENISQLNQKSGPTPQDNENNPEVQVIDDEHLSSQLQLDLELAAITKQVNAF